MNLTNQKHWKYIIIRDSKGNPIEYTCRCKPKRIYFEKGFCEDCKIKYFPNQERQIYYL